MATVSCRGAHKEKKGKKKEKKRKRKQGRVQRLEKIWHWLHQKYSNLAFYEFPFFFPLVCFCFLQLGVTF